MQVWNALHAARCKCRTQKSRQKSPSGHHRTTCRAISSQLRHISTIGKKLLSNNISSTCPHNMANFGPLTAEICSTPQTLADAHYWMPCSNAAKTRNPLKLAGVPKLAKGSQPLEGRSSPYCKDMWRRYCCLTSFFSDCRYVPKLRRYSPTKLWDGAQMATFGDFLHPVFPASRVQHVSDLHPK